MKNTTPDLRYLKMLSRQYPTVQAASSEIINLQTILNLPKGTEHFISDVHGEYEAFLHILNSASGVVREKVDALFATSVSKAERDQLATLIYYPEEKLSVIAAQTGSQEELEEWYRITLHRLIDICRLVTSKYTRSKVRKALPKEYAYIIDELLNTNYEFHNKRDYYENIISTIIDIDRAEGFIIAVCNLIKRMVVDQLHMVGDMFDRGPRADIIMDALMAHHNVDIQWGNHDVVWMGAAAGNECSIANVLRISLRYANMETLEDGYGINLVPLAMFAMETYGDDPCEVFKPKVKAEENNISQKNQRVISQMHKAIFVIQMKLEHDIIARHPEWHMDDRNLLHRIDFEKGTVNIDGQDYPMPDLNFPTVDPADPYRLTDEEEQLINGLVHSFRVSDKLRSHIGTMLQHGSMYTIVNSNLLFHASIPLNADRTMKEVEIRGHKYAGKELLQQTELLMRAPFTRDVAPEYLDFARDYYWYLWCGPDSALFDKSKMATFERYFLTDKGVRHEEKGFYYTLREDAEVCDMLLDAFGVQGEHRHIINGHVPVKAGKGERPVKANGKMMVIDGGFAKAYHDTTGIAGYTLVYHSRGFQLVQHEPFTSEEDAVTTGSDIVSTVEIVELNSARVCVRDTDIGRVLQGQIDELRMLLAAYRKGLLQEKL